MTSRMKSNESRQSNSKQMGDSTRVNERTDSRTLRRLFLIVSPRASPAITSYYKLDDGSSTNIRTMMIGTKQWFVVILGCFTLVHSLSVRVCQNKHCVKRNPNILQTISNLIDVPIESSGCLSHCESGPNVEIHLPGGGSSKVMEGLTDATTVAIQLELHLNFPIPKLLLAASKVMERATQTRGRFFETALANNVGIRRHFLESPFRKLPPFLQWCYLSPKAIVKERTA